MNEVTIKILLTLLSLWLCLGVSTMLTGSLDELNEVHDVLFRIWTVSTASLVIAMSILALIVIWA